MNVFPTATKLAKWMAYLGLVCGVLYSVGGFFFDLFTRGLNWGTLMAFGAIIGMPVVFGTFGFLCGAVIAIVSRGVAAVVDRMGGLGTAR